MTCFLLLFLGLTVVSGVDHHDMPVQVFVLAGQSNMVGMGSVEMLTKLVNNNMTRATYEHLVDDNNAWMTRDDVKVFFPEIQGDEPVPLSVGLGFTNERFGPELEFGRILGDNYDGPTLIIKTAYNGKDMAVDFRPPTRGIGHSTTWQQGGSKDLPEAPLPSEEYGKAYHKMTRTIHSALAGIEEGGWFEGYDTWELKGLVWWHGWNDHMYPKKLQEYEEGLKHLIRDVRHDLNTPELPVVIGEMGQNGIHPLGPAESKTVEMRRIQRAVAHADEFRDLTRFVMTSAYYIEGGETYDGNYHYNGRADTFCQVGKAFGQTMVQLLEDYAHMATGSAD